MYKILIIDDDIDILAVVELVLLHNHFNVHTLSKWQQIPQTIISYSPDLILLDVSLGGADGRDICKQLKSDEQTKQIPVILFSAHYDLINNLKGSKPNAVITKPFENDNLVKTINLNLN